MAEGEGVHRGGGGGESGLGGSGGFGGGRERENFDSQSNGGQCTSIWQTIQFSM